MVVKVGADCPLLLFFSSSAGWVCFGTSTSNSLMISSAIFRRSDDRRGARGLI